MTDLSAVWAIEFLWRDRNGCQNSIKIDWPESIEDARKVAKLLGYPGHKGGWWNYFVEDSSHWMRRITGRASR